MATPILVSYIVLWILVVTQGIALFALYHHFGVMYLNSREGRERQGPPQDEPLKRSRLEDIQKKHLDIPVRNRAALIVFAATTCGLCSEIRPDLRRFALGHEELETIVVCGGRPDAVRVWATELAEAAHVVPDPGHRISAKYKVGVTPFLVGIDAQGTVRVKGIVNDGDGLEFATEVLGVGGEIDELEEVSA
jgi:hypothetical protein